MIFIHNKNNITCKIFWCKIHNVTTLTKTSKLCIKECRIERVIGLITCALLVSSVTEQSIMNAGQKYEKSKQLYINSEVIILYVNSPRSRVQIWHKFLPPFNSDYGIGILHWLCMYGYCTYSNNTFDKQHFEDRDMTFQTSEFRQWNEINREKLYKFQHTIWTTTHCSLRSSKKQSIGCLHQLRGRNEPVWWKAWYGSTLVRCSPSSWQWCRQAWHLPSAALILPFASNNHTAVFGVAATAIGRLRNDFNFYCKTSDVAKVMKFQIGYQVQMKHWVQFNIQNRVHSKVPSSATFQSLSLQVERLRLQFMLSWSSLVENLPWRCQKNYGYRKLFLKYLGLEEVKEDGEPVGESLILGEPGSVEKYFDDDFDIWYDHRTRPHQQLQYCLGREWKRLSK